MKVTFTQEAENVIYELRRMKIAVRLLSAHAGSPAACGFRQKNWNETIDYIEKKERKTL